MGTGAVFDDRKHHTAHVGKQHAAFAKRRCPLDFGRVDQVQALAGVGSIPGNEGDCRRALLLVDPQPSPRLSSVDQYHPPGMTS